MFLLAFTQLQILPINKQNRKTAEETIYPIQKGENKICVKSGGKVSLSTKDSCEEFDITPHSQIDLSVNDIFPMTINLKPIRYRVSGMVKTKKEIPDIALIAKSDQREEKVLTSHKLQDKSSGYYFSFWAYPGEELSFQPQSEEFLFDPEVIHLFVDHSCHDDKVQFEASSGFFLKGHVMPPVAGVKIEIVSSHKSNRQVQGGTKKTFTVTDDKGFYKMGPLPGGVEEQYEVTAKKEGYIFEKVPLEKSSSPTSSTGGGDFVSKKLAGIVVEVKDTESQELSGAVISVSGGKSYRSNTHTKSDGSASFLSLSPAEYFIKPQLKEFEFEQEGLFHVVKST